MALTAIELKTEVLDTYKDLTFEDWQVKVKHRGLTTKFDQQLDWLEDFYPKKVAQLQGSIFEVLPFTPRQLSETIKQWLQRGSEEITIDVQAIDEKIDRLKDKFATTIKEKEFRAKKLVTRKPIGTINPGATYYLDKTKVSGTLTGTWTFTNGSASVTGVGGNALALGATGDCIRPNDDQTEWYVIIEVENDNLITLRSNFQQTNITDTEDATQVNNENGTAVDEQWAHLNQYTKETSRSAGDILLVRANQTHRYDGANLVFDEDGTVASLISIIGCDSVTNDPWSDGSDVKPIISFGDTAYNFYLLYVNYWKLQRLNIKESSDAYGAVNWERGRNFFVDSCDVQENNVAGLFLSSGSSIILSNSTLINNTGSNIYVNGAVLEMDNCVLNGGAIEGSQYGLRVLSGLAFVSNTTFGITTDHSAADIRLDYQGQVFLRNCILDSVAPIYWRTGYVSYHSAVYSEDDNQTYGNHKVHFRNGIITKNTASPRSGGADSYATMQPNAYCGVNYALTLSRNPLFGDFKIWCAAEETTVTIYMRRTADWATEPVASELNIRASYLDHAADATRSLSTASTQTITDANWVAFTTTFTPLQAGWAYVTVYLKKYEAADKGIDVDMLVNSKEQKWIAAQPFPEEVADGGGLLTHPGMSGGMRG